MNRRSVPAVGLAALLVVAGCGSDDDETSAASASTTSTAVVAPSTTVVAPTTEAPTTTTTPDPRAARPYTFTTTQLTFVDDSRSTPESPGGPEIDTRTLDTWLYLPDTDEPAPLVIFSHGMAGHPNKFEDLHTAWAEAGYAVAAPAFPLSNDTAQGSFGNVHDVPNQDDDVSFLLDQLLAQNDDASSELAGRFDADRVATGGLSAGGATTYEAAVNDLDRDPRFRAAIVMAGARFTSPDNGTFEAPTDQPVYLLHGDADPLVPYAGAQETYALLGAPKFFTTLLGGGHAGPFEDTDDGFEPKAPGTDELVHPATIAFLDHYVLGLPEAVDELLVAAEQPDLANFVYETG
ncbi:MAG: alpha/beta hydrolase family protein [Acidimicrobiales bacterium]